MTTSPFFTVNFSKRSAIKSIASYALFAGATGLLVACSPEEKLQFKSIDLTGADYATGFALADQNGLCAPCAFVG